jgi:hypothetical protein
VRKVFWKGEGTKAAGMELRGRPLYIGDVSDAREISTESGEKWELKSGNGGIG